MVIVTVTTAWTRSQVLRFLKIRGLSLTWTTPSFLRLNSKILIADRSQSADPLQTKAHQHKTMFWIKGTKPEINKNLSALTSHSLLDLPSLSFLLLAWSQMSNPRLNLLQLRLTHLSLKMPLALPSLLINLSLVKRPNRSLRILTTVQTPNKCSPTVWLNLLLPQRLACLQATLTKWIRTDGSQCLTSVDWNIVISSL